MTMAAIKVLFLIVLLVGGILLQIFLSRRISRWPGLILPGITFLYSLVMLLSVAAYGGILETLRVMFAVFLLSNIPTAVLLAIYFACRGADRTKKELEKMNSQDLS